MKGADIKGKMRRIIPKALQCLLFLHQVVIRLEYDKNIKENI